VEVVDIFRNVEAIPAIVDEAIAVGAKVVWMQQGLAEPVSARKAREAGLQVVMDRCMKVEHARLAQNEPPPKSPEQRAQPNPGRVRIRIRIDHLCRQAPHLNREHGHPAHAGTGWKPVLPDIGCRAGKRSASRLWKTRRHRCPHLCFLKGSGAGGGRGPPYKNFS
jgi:hypothetical protein